MKIKKLNNNKLYLKVDMVFRYTSKFQKSKFE